MKSKLF